MKKEAPLMKHFSGRTWWICDDAHDGSHILGAIVSEGRIAFDAASSDDHYTITLAPATAGPPWWKGTWRRRGDGARGHAEARLYASGDGGIALVGRWVEDRDFDWITELRP